MPKAEKSKNFPHDLPALLTSTDMMSDLKDVSESDPLLELFPYNPCDNGSNKSGNNSCVPGIVSKTLTYRLTA